MKKMILLIILGIVALAYGVTAIYQGGDTGYSTNSSEVMYAYAYETDGDVNDFDQTLSIGNAILDRVIVDANGTDTSFKLYIYDTSTTYNDATLWSKTDLTTASMPVSQAIVMSDGTGNHPGVPVSGNLQLTLADGDDATLDRLEVFIYYRRR